MKKIIIIIVLFLIFAPVTQGVEVLEGDIRFIDEHKSNRYLGEGDAFFELDYVQWYEGGAPIGGEDWLHLLHIFGNDDEEGMFKIHTYDENRERLRTLVETDVTYSGLIGQDFYRDEDAQYLRVEGGGEWDIEQYLLGSSPDRLKHVEDYAQFSGDSVVLIGPDIEEDKRVFISTQAKATVKAWGSGITYYDTNHAINNEAFIMEASDQAIEVRTRPGADVYMEVEDVAD